MEPPELDNSIYSKHDQLKKAALEKILGLMHKIVGHSIVAFAVGGLLDMSNQACVLALGNKVLPKYRHSLFRGFFNRLVNFATNTEHSFHF